MKRLSIRKIFGLCLIALTSINHPAFAGTTTPEPVLKLSINQNTLTLHNTSTTTSADTLSFVTTGKSVKQPYSNDSCTGKSLAPGASCSLTFSFASIEAGAIQWQVGYQWGSGTPAAKQSGNIYGYAAEPYSPLGNYGINFIIAQNLDSNKPPTPNYNADQYTKIAAQLADGYNTVKIVFFGPNLIPEAGIQDFLKELVTIKPDINIILLMDNLYVSLFNQCWVDVNDPKHSSQIYDNCLSKNSQISQFFTNYIKTPGIENNVRAIVLNNEIGHEYWYWKGDAQSQNGGKIMGKGGSAELQRLGNSYFLDNHIKAFHTYIQANAEYQDIRLGLDFALGTAPNNAIKGPDYYCEYISLFSDKVNTVPLEYKLWQSGGGLNIYPFCEHAKLAFDKQNSVFDRLNMAINNLATSQFQNKQKPYLFFSIYPYWLASNSGLPKDMVSPTKIYNAATQAVIDNFIKEFHAAEKFQFVISEIGYPTNAVFTGVSSANGFSTKEGIANLSLTLAHIPDMFLIETANPPQYLKTAIMWQAYDGWGPKSTTKTDCKQMGDHWGMFVSPNVSNFLSGGCMDEANMQETAFNLKHYVDFIGKNAGMIETVAVPQTLDWSIPSFQLKGGKGKYQLSFNPPADPSVYNALYGLAGQSSPGIFTFIATFTQPTGKIIGSPQTFSCSHLGPCSFDIPTAKVPLQASQTVSVFINTLGTRPIQALWRSNVIIPK